MTKKTSQFKPHRVVNVSKGYRSKPGIGGHLTIVTKDIYIFTYLQQIKGDFVDMTQPQIINRLIEWMEDVED